MQGQEFSTLRGNFAERESNESDTAEKSVVWPPSLDDEKIDIVSASKRYGAENWGASGRHEPTYADLLSGFGANADSPRGYNSPFADQSVRKSMLDQEGKLNLLARPWSLMPSGLSLKLAESNSKVPVQGGDVNYQVRGNVRYGGFGDYPLLHGNRIEHSHGNWLMPPLPPPQFENSAHSRELMPKPVLVQDQEAGKSKDCKLFGIPLFSNPVMPEPVVSDRNTVNKPVGNIDQQFRAFESDQKSEQSKSSKLADNNQAVNDQDKKLQACQPHTKDVRSKPQSGSARSCTKVTLVCNIQFLKICGWWLLNIKNCLIQIC